MRSIESEGDSIDQAIDSALRALQVERDRVEIEILADATRGFLGFGGKKARIRATVRASLWADRSPEDTAENPPVSRGTSAARSTAGAARSSTPERPADIETASSAAAPPGLEARCTEVLGEILRLVGMSCSVAARAGNEPGGVLVEVDGDSSGLLIGRRGQTLDALEYILNRIVAREDEGRSARITVDVERYRERRREYLEALARRLADKARETGRVVTLNPMSPRDRRIVHLALQDDAAVATRSQGDGYYRKVLILPGERASHGSQTERSPG